MKDIVEAFDEIVGDASGSEAIEKIRESDELQIHKAERDGFDEDYDGDPYDYENMPESELKAMFEVNYSQIYELECFGTSDLARYQHSMDELIERGFLPMTEEVENFSDKQGAVYDIYYAHRP